MRFLSAVFLAGLASNALAQEMPVPKLFKGLEGQKGEYKVEFLEGGPAMKEGRRMPAMTVCSDNLIDSASRAEKRSRRGADCTRRLLKDTDEEAVMESVCTERKSTVTMKRESPKSLVMDIVSTGPRGERKMKMRYTHLGPCREG